MSRRPLNTEARLYVDGMPTLALGHYIVTANGKTGYFVTRMRPSPTIAGRRYLVVLRTDPAQIPEEATVHRLRWYRRDRARPKRAPR